MVVSKQLHSRARQREVTCGPRLLQRIPLQRVLLNRTIEVYRCLTIRRCLCVQANHFRSGHRAGRGGQGVPNRERDSTDSTRVHFHRESRPMAAMFGYVARPCVHACRRVFRQFPPATQL